MATSRGRCLPSPTWAWSPRFDEDLLAARSWHEQALRLARTLDDRFSIARLCYLLGAVRRLLGDYAAAAELFAEAAPLLDTKDPCLRRVGLDFSGDLAVDERQYERAAELYTNGAAPLPACELSAGVSLVTQRIGIMAIRMGDERRGVRILVGTA